MAKANHTACCIEGCSSKHKSRGYCATHYMQFRRGTLGRQVTCKQCGEPFASTSKLAMYCSKKCKHAAWIAKNAERHAEHRRNEAECKPKFSVVAFNKCLTCGISFVSQRKKKYCSDECLPKPIYISIAPKEKVCRWCGNRYAPAGTGGRPSEYCGDSCRSAADKAAKRIDKAKRHVRKQGATVERVDPFVVFNRDKWKCRLCGCKTPSAKRGTYEDDAPELDHIMPLSKGGEHSYRNTQCSCRKCNGLKSDTPRGQALLFG